MSSQEVSPPSYDEVMKLATNRIGSDPTPEKVIHVVSALSVTESRVLADEKLDPHTLMQGLDREAFDQGLNKYLRSEEAKTRLKTNADEATKACQMINTIFSNLAVKLGEIDSKNIGDVKFVPNFKDLQKSYNETLRKSAKLAMSMGEYAARFEEKILRVVLEPRIKYDKKKEYIDDYIKEAKQFEIDATQIQTSFTSLQTDFGVFTGSFKSWAKGEENKHSKEIEDLGKEIATLKAEIDEIKGKMALWGVVGTIGTVGATAGLVILLGPVGLVAGLIGAGVTIGFMIHWNNEINNRNKTKDEKTKKLQAFQSEADSIVATRAQLVELGDHSFTVFKNQLSTLNTVWSYAMNDAYKVQIALERLKKDGKDMDDEFLRQIMVLPNVGDVSGLYTVMATYLNQYADGIHKGL